MFLENFSYYKRFKIRRENSPHIGLILSSLIFLCVCSHNFVLHNLVISVAKIRSFTDNAKYLRYYFCFRRKNIAKARVYKKTCIQLYTTLSVYPCIRLSIVVPLCQCSRHECITVKSRKLCNKQQFRDYYRRALPRVAPTSAFRVP